MTIVKNGVLRTRETTASVLGVLSLLVTIISPASADTWENRVSVYGWLAGIDGTTRFPIDNPAPIEVDVSDIIDDINMVFMGNYEGRSEKWSVLTDVVYLDLGDSRSVGTALGSARAGLDIKSWVVHAAFGYALPAPKSTPVNLIAGVRYLSLDGELEASLGNGPGRSASESESVTDAIVGVRGQVSLNENWFLPYHADLGAGGSDYSYQLFGGVGYRAGALDFEIGYRHIYFDLGDDRFMKEFQISGPALGLGFRF
jgi:hypothetical protein